MTPGRTRAGAILVQNAHVALIERRGSARGAHYYVFPGGGVEAGESLDDAARREVLEELGLDVAVEQCVATVHYNGGVQHYFLARVVGGDFGTGQGAEMDRTHWAVAGSYRPLWMPCAEIMHHRVYPRGVAELVAAAAGGGWPSLPERLWSDVRATRRADDCMMNERCPCCGYVTLEVRGNFEICGVWF